MNGKKLVFIDIDGINPDVFYRVLDDKNSNLHRLAGRGLRADKAVTIFPSVTLCCQATMFTGAFPATHRIMGNSWFDRAKNPPEFRFYTDAKTAAGNYGFALFGMPNIVLPKKPGLDFANRDMCPNVMTIYEAANKKGLRSWQVFNQYSRGVEDRHWIRPSRPAMILFALCHEELVDNKHWDSATFKHLYRAMRRGEELPDLLTFYISGHDNNSHENGPEDQYRYFSKVVDPLFGDFISEFQKHGNIEDFHFLITADHGQAAMVKKEENIIYNETLGETLAAVPGGGFHLAPRKTVSHEHTAVGAMEAGACQFHLKNRATFNWPDPPRFEQDVIPAADAFLAYKKGPTPFVDFVLVRRSVEEGYMVYNNGGGLATLEEHFAGKEDRYPDAARRLRGLNCDRSGDMIVILDYDSDFYFGDSVKAGEHGNLCAEDALIPFVVSGPDIPEKTIPFVSLVDAAPTAAAILGFDIPTAEGKSVL